MAATQISDIIVPEVFDPYIMVETEEKTRLIQSGVMVSSDFLNRMLVGGGSTFNVPAFLDLDASDSTGAENVATDTLADIQTASFENATPTDANRGDAVPAKIQTAQEIAARMVRNKSWSAMGLSQELSGAVPMAAIGSRVATYWARRIQSAFVSVWNGIIADNAATPSGTDTHTQGDLTNDVSGSSYSAGVTDFNADTFLDTTLLLGDSMEDLSIVMVHSVVYSRMQKNNLIDFIPDARGETMIPTFLGREVVVDDGMPRTGSVYDTWLFGAGACSFGQASHDVPTEVSREPLAGNGDGQEILTTRRVMSVHPTGHAYIQGSIPGGGPSNANLAAAANWSRVYPERKQIKFARMVTRES